MQHVVSSAGDLCHCVAADENVTKLASWSGSGGGRNVQGTVFCDGSREVLSTLLPVLAMVSLSTHPWRLSTQGSSRTGSYVGNRSEWAALSFRFARK